MKKLQYTSPLVHTIDYSIGESVILMASSEKVGMGSSDSDFTAGAPSRLVDIHFIGI